MSVLGAVALAFFAGVISFTSPCCLPLMPGYVSYVSGVASEGWKLLNEAVGEGAPATSRYPNVHQTSPF